MQFTARVVIGSGRGTSLSVPTINVDLVDVPADLKEGIYAARVSIDGQTYPVAMHYGPRPVFNDSPSCELHCIDATISTKVNTVDVEVLERIRDVQNFASPEELTAQMHNDIARIRDILGVSNGYNT